MGGPPPPPPPKTAAKEKLPWKERLSPKIVLRKWRDRRLSENSAFSAARNQRTPFGINRYALLIVSVIYTWATARVYFNWAHLSGLLYHYQAYIWLCPDDGPDLRDDGKRYKCDDQDIEMQNLFLACLATAFSFSLVAGTLLDIIGPKLTGIIGQILNAIAWLLLSFASESTQTYLPAFIIMGLGSDTGFLPGLPVANLFPGNEGLIVAVLGAAKSASFAVPTFLLRGAENTPGISLQTVCLWYMGLGPLLCVVIAAVFYPYMAFLPWNEFVAAADGDNALDGDNPEAFPLPQHRYSIQSLAVQTRRGSLASVHGGGHAGSRRRSHVGSIASRGSSVHVAMAQNGTGEGLVEESTAVAADDNLSRNGKSGGGGAFSASETKCSEDIDGPSAISVMEDGRDVLLPDSASGFGSVTTSLRRASKGAVGAKSDRSVHTLEDEYGLNETGFVTPMEDTVVTASFTKQFCSMFNWGIIVYAVIRSIMYAFFTTAMEHLVGKAVTDFAGTMLPISFIPCIIVGKVVDWYGIILVLFVLNSFITLGYSFTLIGVEACGYIAVVFYICYVSFYSSQLYCFVSDTFEAKHFGKFVGITSMIAGLASLTKIGIQKLTKEVLDNNYLYPTIVMLGFCGISFLLIGFLFVIKRKNPHPFWPKKQVRATCKSVPLLDVVEDAVVGPDPESASIVIQSESDFKPVAGTPVSCATAVPA